MWYREAYRWLQLEGKIGQALPERSHLFQEVSGISAIKKGSAGSVGGWGTEDDLLDIWSDCCQATQEKKEEDEEERQQPTTSIESLMNDMSNDDNYVSNAAIATEAELVGDASMESMEIDKAEESKVEEQQQEEPQQQEEEQGQEEEGQQEEQSGNDDAWLDSV